jgi:hypothetical protein
MDSPLPTPTAPAPRASGPIEKVRAIFRRLSDLPPWAEPLIWTFLIALTIGARLYLIHLLPLALWSKDAGSYAYAAIHWINTGIWETDPRRGPIYSLLIALCGKLWGSIYSLMILQHIMGVTAILLSIFALRLLHGRRALIPLAACGYAYAVHGLPLYMEHLVRNETILFFCGTVSLVTWLFAIHWRQPHWLWITGIAAAILAATKNVWFPFPVLFTVATLWYFRKEMRLAVTQVLIFAVAFGVPYMGAKIFKHRTLGVDRSDEPQEGVLLYGRTAQFTYLDGGIYPDLKNQIRSQVEAYQREVIEKKKLNNNEILKKTVVPHLSSIYRREGKTGDDINQLCEALALEAIRTHPLQYGQQVWHDMVRMHLNSGVRYVAPDDSEVASQLDLLKELQAPDPILHVPDSLAKLNQIAGVQPGADQGQPPKKVKRHLAKGRFATYRHLLLSSWLFDLAPVLFTSLLLPLVWWLSPVPTRAWWFGSAGIWYFTVVLLSTVGRPLDRYLIPALPVMFFTLSSAVMLAWNALAAPSKSSLPPASKTTN